MQNDTPKTQDELDDQLHEELLSEGNQRFPEESFQQLRKAGASEQEALQMLGYGPDRKPLPKPEQP